MGACRRLLPALLGALALAGCATTGFPVPRGEGVTCLGITYRVAGVCWAHRIQTGSGPALPAYGFLLVEVELTNARQSELPAEWLPKLCLVDEHEEVLPASPLSAAIPGGLRPAAQSWRPGQTLRGTVVFDAPQVLYWLQPEGCSRMVLDNWWPECIDGA